MRTSKSQLRLSEHLNYLIVPVFRHPESLSIELFQYLLSVLIGPISCPPRNVSAVSLSAKLTAIFRPAVETNNWLSHTNNKNIIAVCFLFFNSHYSSYLKGCKKKGRTITNAQTRKRSTPLIIGRLISPSVGATFKLKPTLCRGFSAFQITLVLVYNGNSRRRRRSEPDGLHNHYIAMKITIQ